MYSNAPATAEDPTTPGRRPGGVAIIVPCGWRVVQHAAAWPGYIIAAQLVDPSGTTRNVASVYLPPDGGADAAAHLHALPDWEGPWLAAGDLNFDVAEPRNATDLAGAERAGRWAEQRGLVAIGTG